MRNFFKHVERSGLPMTIHIGVANVDYGIADEFGLPGLERTLLDFPKLRVLGHSQRFWSHLGGDITQAGWGGYPAGRVVPGGRVVELMRRCPNLCGDLSAGSGCNALLRDPAFAWDFIEEFQDRLYYGTDICSPANLGDMRVKLAAFLDESMESGKISYAAYEKVCRGNALKLLEG